jgi:carbon-monoxide dehydrogenase medium subunit
MKPASFDYAAPASTAEAVSLLEKHGDDAKILAGGQSLMPLLNMRLARPSVLVDLGRIAELDFIRETDDGLVVGAMTTKRAVERSPLVARRQPMLLAATQLIAHPQIRNRGTLGGSMAQADPASEYPALAVALGAEMRVVGPSGERVVAAPDFFVTYLTTALEPNELLTEVRLPSLTGRSGWAFQEVARRHGDYAMAGIAITASLDRKGRFADARVAFFGVGPTPLRATGVEQLLAGESPSESLFEQAARQVADEIGEPLSDVHASAEYRRHLAQVLTRRGLAEAAERAASAA